MKTLKKNLSQIQMRKMKKFPMYGVIIEISLNFCSEFRKVFNSPLIILPQSVEKVFNNASIEAGKVFNNASTDFQKILHTTL